MVSSFFNQSKSYHHNINLLCSSFLLASSSSDHLYGIHLLHVYVCLFFSSKYPYPYAPLFLISSFFVLLPFHLLIFIPSLTEPYFCLILTCSCHLPLRQYLFTDFLLFSLIQYPNKTIEINRLVRETNLRLTIQTNINQVD